MTADKDTAGRSNAAVADSPDVNLLITQLQVAIGRLSMRDNHGINPLSAAFHLQNRHTAFELSVERGDRAAVEAALADLYVASVWVADGYGVALKKAYQDSGHGMSLGKILSARTGEREQRHPADELRAARVELSKIIRNIGLYEIGYGQHETGSLPPLREAIPAFHVALLDIGVRQELDVLGCLADAFRLEAMSGLSSVGHNPLYAASARQFAPVVQGTYCPFATTANLWGAPDHNPALSVRDNVRGSLDSMLRFTRAAQREGLDGYVFAFPADPFGEDLDRLSSLLRTLIGTLMENDPRTSRAFDRREVVRDDWRFSFCGEDYFVPVFAPLYSQGHSRYTYEVSDTVFILLQPDSSFHARLNGDRDRIRSQIRQRFADGLQAYDTTRDIEAHRFLLPQKNRTAAPAWYDADPL